MQVVDFIGLMQASILLSSSGFVKPVKIRLDGIYIYKLAATQVVGTTCIKHVHKKSLRPCMFSWCYINISKYGFVEMPLKLCTIAIISFCHVSTKL